MTPATSFNDPTTEVQYGVAMPMCEVPGAGRVDPRRRVAGLGLPTLVLQEGGYFVPKLGENARTWLRGREHRLT